MQIKMNKNNARSVIFPFTSNYCRGKCCCLNYRNQKKTEKKMVYGHRRQKCEKKRIGDGWGADR